MPIWYGIQNTQMRVGDEIIADYEIAIVIDPGEEVEKIVKEIKERGLILWIVFVIFFHSMFSISTLHMVIVIILHVLEIFRNSLESSLFIFMTPMFTW